MFRRVVGGVGRALMAAGALLLLFVTYQLWGTGLQESRAQADLRSDFEEALQAGPDPVTATEAPLPAPEGEAVAVIRIPRIDVEKVVVEGVGVLDLKKGPGHYPTTPMPGQAGNAAIAGHRTTYGAPFYELQELDEGDEIMVRTRQGEFRYVVDRTMVVSPSQVEVLDPTDEARLTLTTCNPRFSARQRLVVSGVLAGEAAPAAPAPPAPPAPPTAAPPVALDDPAGLSGDPAARGPVVLWGSLAGLVWLLTWALGRRWRRLPAYLVGVPVFLVVLFVFFENVARLFPANV